MVRRAAAIVTVLALWAGLAPAGSVAQQDPSVTRMRGDVAVLARSPREAGTAAELAAFDHIASVLRSVGLRPTATDVPLANGRTSRNLEVAFGGGPVEILLGAHVDSVRGSPGADDNASGTAVLLEYARRLAAGAAPVPAGTTVSLVWFGAEEILAGMTRDHHHAGSRQLAAARHAAGQHPHWMLSVDMLGYGPTAVAAHVSGTDADAARVLSGAAQAAGAPAAVVARGDISDHGSFARYGTTAALLWRPDNPTYHGAGDTEVRDDRLAAGLRTVEVFVGAAASPFVSGRGMAHQLVVDLLARRPDVAGAGFFAGRPAGEVGAALLSSAEWAAVVAPVARVYLAAFGRHADHGGLVHWTGVRRRGVGLATVASQFVASAEFGARYGNPDDAGFVRLLYRNVLGRDPDPDGQAYWVGELESRRRSRADVLVAFAESAEHRARTQRALPVALAYAGLLRRPPDAAGLSYWAGRPLAELVGGLAGSEEFRRRFS